MTLDEILKNLESNPEYYNTGMSVEMWMCEHNRDD
jgi:hypothetical protein